MINCWGGGGFQYCVRRLIIRAQKDPKVHDWCLEFPSHIKNWLVSHQLCRTDSCQISRQFEGFVKPNVTPACATQKLKLNEQMDFEFLCSWHIPPKIYSQNMSSELEWNWWLPIMVISWHGKTFNFTGPLTHCGLVMPYGDIDLNQHWLR